MTTKICQGEMGHLLQLKNNFKKSICLAFLIFILSSCYAFSKGKQDDMLLSATEIEMNDLGELAKQHFQENNLLMAEEYAQLLLVKANYNQYIKGRAEAFKILGVINIEKQAYFEALEQLRKSLFLYETLQDKIEIAKLNNNIGDVYQEIELYQEAIHYFEKAIATYQEENAPELLAHTYRNIGNSYAMVMQYQKAISYYEKALPITEAYKNFEDIIFLYDDIGILKRKLGLNKEALKCYNYILELDKKNEDLVLSIYTYNNIGYFYGLEKNYSLAKKYLEKALALSQKDNFKGEIIYKIYNNLGLLALSQNNIKEALAYFQAAEKLDIQPEGRELVFTYENLTNIYQTLHDEAKATFYQHKKQTLEKALDARIVLFKQIRQEKIQLIDKTLQDFKNQNASFFMDMPFGIALFAFIAFIFMAFFYYYAPFKQFTLAGIELKSQNLFLNPAPLLVKPAQTNFLTINQDENHKHIEETNTLEQPIPLQQLSEAQLMLPPKAEESVEQIPELPPQSAKVQRSSKKNSKAYEHLLVDTPISLHLLHPTLLKKEKLLNLDIDSPYLIEIQRQKGSAYYLENRWQIRNCDGFKPLHPQNPYFPLVLPATMQEQVVLQLAQLAIWKKNMALHHFESAKQALENRFDLVIDKPIGIFSYYADWLITQGFYPSHKAIAEKIYTPANLHTPIEETFTNWIKQEAVSIPILAKYAQLCLDAIVKDLCRQGDNIIMFEELKGKAYTTSLEHPTAYTSALYTYYKLIKG